MFRSEFYKNNRDNLSSKLKNHLIIISANSLMQSSADLSFPFRQDSNFLYLTGVNEPDLLLVIDTDKNESTILLPARSEYQDEWDGAISREELKKVSGADEISFKADLKLILKDATKRGLKVGILSPMPEVVEPYGFYSNPARKKLEESVVDQSGLKVEQLVDIRKDIARLRQIKQPEELQAIQKAIDVTATTLASVRAELSSFGEEKAIERAITAGFYLNGGDGNAYEPIVASGKNAATIHYTANCDKVAISDLLLLDVGAQVDGYAADISRTWAVDTPTERQKELYEGVLEMQQKAISMLKPGVIIREYQEKMEKYAQKIMKRMKCSNADQPFPHGFSHFLGLDVHDAGIYDEPLLSGMVLTVEPGIYLHDEGIGIRIEDNVLITEKGVKVLSESIPKML